MTIFEELFEESLYELSLYRRHILHLPSGWYPLFTLGLREDPGYCSGAVFIWTQVPGEAELRGKRIRVWTAEGETRDGELACSENGVRWILGNPT